MSEKTTENEMSFLGHLEELRWRLVRSVIVILIIAVVLFYFTDPIVKLVYLNMSKTNFPTYQFFCFISEKLHIDDLLCADDIPIQIQSIEMTKQFTTNMYFALIGGFIVSFPFTFFQIWSFIKPGLKAKEVKATRWIVFNASFLFFLGVLFGYYLISPLCVQFFGGYKLTDEIQNNFTISSYMSMITTSTFLTGIFFELPVIMYLLAKIGILGSAILKKYRRHSLVVILILSAIITPPDVVSQLLVTIPVYSLYEIGVLVVKRVEKEIKRAEKVMELQAEKINKTYKGRKVVKDVSLTLKKGEIVGLLGPNGAGKTTSFYMIVGLIKPDTGNVFLHQNNITKVPMYKRSKMGIGYLPQEVSVFRKLSVEDNIKAILEMSSLSKKEQKIKLESLIEEFGLGHVRKTMGIKLSGGEKRRTEIARCLANEPDFILLDEPFAGVDPIAVEDIQRIVLKLREKKIGILITDHNVQETLSIVDRAYLLFEGAILKSGTAEELAEDEQVRKVYLGQHFKLQKK